MNLLEITKARYSVRNYTNQKIEQDKIDRILEAAHAAPTAANLQPVRLFVISQPENLAKLNKAANTYNAPLAVLVCSDRTKAWTRPFDGKQTTDIDATILTDHMMLEATALGLGTVWICYFNPDTIKQEFNLPEGLEPINILAIGYSNETPANPNRHTTQRIPLTELITNL